MKRKLNADLMCSERCPNLQYVDSVQFASSCNVSRKRKEEKEPLVLLSTTMSSESVALDLDPCGFKISLLVN